MKSKSLFLLLLLLLLLAFIALTGTLNVPAQKNEFIGYEHKGVVYGETLPNGARDLGGGLLSDSLYAVTRFSKNKKHYLWLEMITDRDKEGVPSWIVLDALELPEMKSNQKLLFSYSSTCTVDGREDLDVIVLAEERPKRKNSYRVLRAWRANLEREEFETVATRGIVCGRQKP